MRVLCISPLFVPLANPEAFCGAKMVKALMDANIDIKVFTFNNESSKQKTRDESSLWKPLSEKVVNTVYPMGTDRCHAILSAIRYRTIVWARWVDIIVKHAVKCHEEIPFDIVYSRSLPMIAHVAGYWVSKKLRLPWIVNINDAWDEHLFPGRTNALSHVECVISNYWLKKTFNTADLLEFPSDRLRDYHLKIVHSSKSTQIIPHIGYSTEEKFDNKNGFHLIHAGLFGSASGLRSPAGLLAGLRRFLLLHPESRSITKLILVGAKDSETELAIKNCELDPYVIITGIVSYENSLKYINTATVCVLLEEKMKEGIYLPSKLIDYIMLKKPILALSPGIGVVADMLPCNWIIRADMDDEVGIARSIATLYEEFKKGSIINRVPPEDVLSQFRSANVATKFLSALRFLKNEK